MYKFSVRIDDVRCNRLSNDAIDPAANLCQQIARVKVLIVLISFDNHESLAKDAITTPVDKLINDVAFRGRRAQSPIFFFRAEGVKVIRKKQDGISVSNSPTSVSGVERARGRSQFGSCHILVKRDSMPRQSSPRYVPPRRLSLPSQYRLLGACLMV